MRVFRLLTLVLMISGVFSIMLLDMTRSSQHTTNTVGKAMKAAPAIALIKR